MNIIAFLAILPLVSTPQAEDPKSPPISAEHWENQLGQAPTLQSLSGKAVLIEAWATW